MDSKNCSNCKYEKPIADFFSLRGKEVKMCQRCRDMAQQRKLRNCEHLKGYQKEYQKEYRNENKEIMKVQRKEYYAQNKEIIKEKMKEYQNENKEIIKEKKKEYRNENKCIHDIGGKLCKICNDVVKIRIDGWVKHSRFNDKRKGQFDPDHFIDKCFLKGLIEDSLICVYCGIETQLAIRDHTQTTIERKSNLKGHIKSNCVLACLGCNSKRIGQREEEEELEKQKKLEEKLQS